MSLSLFLFLGFVFFFCYPVYRLRLNEYSKRAQKMPHLKTKQNVVGTFLRLDGAKTVKSRTGGRTRLPLPARPYLWKVEVASTPRANLEGSIQTRFGRQRMHSPLLAPPLPALQIHAFVAALCYLSCFTKLG